MTVTEIDAAGVPASLRESGVRFGEAIRSACESNATGLALFGAALEGGFDIARQAVRSVLVVREVKLDQLKRIALEGPSFGRDGYAAPLVMTPDYIQRSVDVFPLELLEIQQKNAPLFGEVPLEGVTFDASNVRLQCERDLKAVLIGMRQGVLASVGFEKMLGQIESDVADGLVRVLRGVLFLKGTDEWLSRAAVIAGTETALDVKLDALREAATGGGKHTFEHFEALYKEVDLLVERVDAL